MIHGIKVDYIIKQLEKLDRDKYIVIGKESDSLGQFDINNIIIETRKCGFDDESDDTYYAICGKVGFDQRSNCTSRNKCFADVL